MNWIKYIFSKKYRKQCAIPVVSITLTERIITTEKHKLDEEGKVIKIEKPPFN